MGYEFVAPTSKLSRVDGICRIGIHPDSGYAVLALDTTINVALTGIFIWQLRPALGSSVTRSPTHLSTSSSGRGGWSVLNFFRGNNNDDRSSALAKSQRNLKVMLFRNVVGSSLVLCATIANNAIFLTWSFAAHSHACQLMCLTDSKKRDPGLEYCANRSSCIGYASNELADYAFDSRTNRGFRAERQHLR